MALPLLQLALDNRSLPAACEATRLLAAEVDVLEAGTILICAEGMQAVRTLKALYRWPLFIPFIVAAQCMRTFLAKNGLMNNTFVSLGLMEPLQAVSFLDWRGIIWNEPDETLG